MNANQTPAHRFADAAAGLAGTPFRLHGRSIVGGLDCVGLVACALQQCGQMVRAPGPYGLRNRRVDGLLHLAADNGFAAVAEGPLRRGDLMLFTPGPAQHHLAIAHDAASMIYAHAGLRRVVIQPIQPDWPLLRQWRLVGAEPAITP